MSRVYKLLIISVAVGAGFYCLAWGGGGGLAIAVGLGFLAFLGSGCGGLGIDFKRGGGGWGFLA